MNASTLYDLYARCSALEIQNRLHIEYLRQLRRSHPGDTSDTTLQFCLNLSLAFDNSLLECQERIHQEPSIQAFLHQVRVARGFEEGDHFPDSARKIV